MLYIYDYRVSFSSIYVSCQNKQVVKEKLLSLVY